MKKTKLLAAFAAAAVLAIGGGVFAGCGGNGGGSTGGEGEGGHTHTYTTEWSKNETHHYHVANCGDLHEGDDEYKKDEEPHTWGEGDKNNECTVCHYTKTPVATEYKVTLHVGNDGSVAEGTTLEYTTVNGKLPFGADEYLPEPTANAEHWHFVNWYDAAEGGNAIVEAETVFTENTDIYARYARDNGMWNEDGSVFVTELKVNLGNEETSYTEYWFGQDEKVTFHKDDVLTIYLNDAQYENFWLNGTCVDLSADVNNYGGVSTSTVTITEDAQFTVYLKVYNDGGSNFKFNGTTLAAYEETSELPSEDAKAITVTFNGEDVTLYIIDSEGTVITEANAENYWIYAWEDGGASNVLGGWKETKLSDNITTDSGLYSNTMIKICWDVEVEGEVQTKETNAVNKFEVGKAYVINYQTGDVKIYVASEEGIDPGDEGEEPGDNGDEGEGSDAE